MNIELQHLKRTSESIASHFNQVRFIYTSLLIGQHLRHAHKATQNKPRSLLSKSVAQCGKCRKTSTAGLRSCVRGEPPPPLTVSLCRREAWPGSVIRIRVVLLCTLPLQVQAPSSVYILKVLRRWCVMGLCSQTHTDTRSAQCSTQCPPVSDPEDGDMKIIHMMKVQRTEDQVPDHVTPACGLIKGQIDEFKSL